MLLLRCLIVVLLLATDLVSIAHSAEVQNDWQKTLDAAKKEGTVVFATAADVELRRQLEPALKRRFGISLLPNSRRRSFKRVRREFVLMTSSPLAVAAG